MYMLLTFLLSKVDRNYKLNKQMQKPSKIAVSPNSTILEGPRD